MAVLTPEDCAAAKAPGRLLRRVEKLAIAYVEDRFEAEGFDLSFQQWVALKVVRDGLITNAGELAREMGITTGATTRLIDGLEARGLMERDRSSADRRVVGLAVTEAGRAATQAQGATAVDAWNELLVDLDRAEVDAFVATLTKILRTAERITGARHMEVAA